MKTKRNDSLMLEHVCKGNQTKANLVHISNQNNTNSDFLATGLSCDSSDGIPPGNCLKKNFNTSSDTLSGIEKFGPACRFNFLCISPSGSRDNFDGERPVNSQKFLAHSALPIPITCRSIPFCCNASSAEIRYSQYYEMYIAIKITKFWLD